MPLAPPVQDTFTVGEVLTSASMNRNVRDAVNFLAATPTALLYQATAQSIPDSTWTPIAFDTEVVDDYAGHSNSTNPTRYVAQEVGYYQIIGQVGIGTFSTAGRRLARLLVNGASVLNGSQSEITPGSGNVTIPTFGLVRLAVGDYVELQGQQTSGAAMSTGTGPQGSSLLVRWVHA